MLSLYIFISVFSVSLISFIGALTLSWSKELLQKALYVLVGLAAGALFGDAFIHLIPEAFEQSNDYVAASLVVLSGILIFFILEKFLHWHHHHNLEQGEDDCEHEILGSDSGNSRQRIKPLGILILTSDSLHNFIDGAIIAASFLVSVEVGIATAVAVALHEIPQEIADFSLLIHSGMRRFQAFFWNFFSALFAVLGAGLTVLFGNFFESNIFIALAFAAGTFIYIAGSDLVPEIHKTHNVKKSAIQFLSIFLGIIIMLSLTLLEGGEKSKKQEENSHKIISEMAYVDRSKSMYNLDNGHFEKGLSNLHLPDAYTDQARQAG